MLLLASEVSVVASLTRRKEEAQGFRRAIESPVGRRASVEPLEWLPCNYSRGPRRQLYAVGPSQMPSLRIRVAMFSPLRPFATLSVLCNDGNPFLASFARDIGTDGRLAQPSTAFCGTLLEKKVLL